MGNFIPIYSNINMLISFLVNKILKPREKTAMQITFNSNVKVSRSYEAIFIGYLKLAQNVRINNSYLIIKFFPNKISIFLVDRRSRF